MFRFAKRVLGVLGAAGTGVAASLAVTAPASAATYYEIQSYNWRNNCISVEGGGSTANGANVIQWPCNDGSEQRWYWSGHTLRNAKSGKCLSVAGGGSTANGAELIQWTCNGGAEQNWYVEQTYWIRNGNSGKYISVSGGGSTDPGAKLIQWPYNSGPEQGWIWVAKSIDT